MLLGYRRNKFCHTSCTAGHKVMMTMTVQTRRKITSSEQQDSDEHCEGNYRSPHLDHRERLNSRSLTPEVRESHRDNGAALKRTAVRWRNPSVLYLSCFFALKAYLVFMFANLFTVWEAPAACWKETSTSSSTKNESFPSETFNTQVNYATNTKPIDHYDNFLIGPQQKHVVISFNLSQHNLHVDRSESSEQHG